MKIFRFMSKKEFDKYLNDEILENNTVHKGKTNSIGFCFLDYAEHRPEEAMHFLSGVVSFDICAVFEVDEKMLNKSWGRYAEPIKHTEDPLMYLMKAFAGVFDSFETKEYCTTNYSKKDFKLIQYTTNIWHQYGKRENQKGLLWIKGDETNK